MFSWAFNLETSDMKTTNEITNEIGYFINNLLFVNGFKSREQRTQNNLHFNTNQFKLTLILNNILDDLRGSWLNIVFTFRNNIFIIPLLEQK